MVVRSIGNKAEPEIFKLFRQCFRILNDLALVLFELFREGFLKSYSLGGNDMHEGTALGTREHTTSQNLGVPLLAHNQTAPGPPKGFVGGRGHKLADRYRCRVITRCDQTGDVGDIAHNDCPDLIGRLAEGGEIDDPGISAGADDNHFGLMLLRQIHHLVVIDRFRCAIDTVGDDAVIFTGKIGGAAMGQMAAMGEIHPQNCVARL